MLIRFLIILSLTFVVFFMLRWWAQKRQSRRNCSTNHAKNAKERAQGKQRVKLIRDLETGEYRPQRDDNDE